MNPQPAARNKKLPTPPPLDAHGLLEQILHNGSYAAVLLLICAVFALFCANAAFPVWQDQSLADLYAALWHLDLGIAIGPRSVTQTLHHWVNDGLMAIFFFLVGLEIKRELMVGELATARKAALPIGAAIGGMIVPAGIYALLNNGTDGAAGWGIPMATDIAFAMGVLGLLSKRVPIALSVFLMALAIVDDLGAVVVIAMFYTHTIAAEQLFTGLALTALSFALGYAGVRSSLVYALLFGCIWITFLQSGVHATVAGVLFAFSIPVDARYQTSLFSGRIRALLDRFEQAEDEANPLQVNAAQQHLVSSIERECLHVEAPLQRIERLLHPACAFLIMPIFAFANAGVVMEFGSLSTLLESRVLWGVALGLLVGKQVGIFGFSWLMVRSGLAELPRGVTWLQLYGVAILGSIGFTMSLFVTELAFAPGIHGGVEHLVSNHAAEAKVGVLSASIVAGVMGILVLYGVTSSGGGTSSPGHGEPHHA